MHKVVFSTLIALFLLSAMVVTSSAQSRTVGVKVGDWFKYGDVAAQWNSNDPKATPPFAFLNSFNDVAWMEMIITAVSGTNVTAQQIMHYRNGSETSSNGWVDINTGDADLFNDFIVSANLIPGEPEYGSTAYEGLIINNTIVEDFHGITRYLNHFNTTYSSTSGSSLYGESVDYTWDMLTGVAMGVYHFLLNQTGPYTSTLSYHFSMTDSNLIPEFPTWASALLILILLTYSVLAISKRRYPKR
jgi:hypothetical protein